MEHILEMEVLAAVLKQPSLFPNLMSVVDSECFVDPVTKRLYSEMRYMYLKKQTIEVNNIKHHILKDKEEEIYDAMIDYLDLFDTYDINFSLFEEKITTLAYPKWERETVENIKRVVEQISRMPISNEEKVARMRERLLKRVDNAPVLKNSQNSGKLFLSYLQGGRVDSVSTGYPTLDSLLGSLLPTQFVIVAGRPAMGKSTLAYNIMNHFVKNYNDSCLVFSLEIGSVGIYKRLTTMETGLSPKGLHNGDPDTIQQITDVTKRYIKLEEKGILQIESDGQYNLTNIENIIRTKSQVRKVKVVIIDYVQLINVPGNSYERTTQISKKLKEIARRYNLIIIGLSQLSREVEKRSEKRPIMSDLRDSGSLEQDADKILMVYRDDYYNRDTPPTNIIEVDVVKNREGATGMVPLKINLITGKIMEEENATN